ncbi:MAG: hypothetical protein ACLQVI_35540 [Polyangiaceae bacterium]|jgi:hypothetical protein
MDENWQLVEAGVEIVLTMIAGHWLFAWDEKRMTEEQRERAWPEASRGTVVCSPLWFFPLWLVGVPLHFLRTRRNLRGVAEAIGWTAAMFALLMAIGTVFEILSD